MAKSRSGFFQPEMSFEEFAACRKHVEWLEAKGVATVNQILKAHNIPEIYSHGLFKRGPDGRRHLNEGVTEKQILEHAFTQELFDASALDVAKGAEILERRKRAIGY